jgi:DNA-binding protein HU-beta
MEYSCAIPVRRARSARTLQTLKKKALQAHQHLRNSLRMRPHVLFFGAIRYARCGPRARVTNVGGEQNMAKKGGAPTKSEILTQISKDTSLSRKQVSGVFDSLSGVIKKSLRSNGLFTLPGLLKLKVVKKPATKAREGVNPFTGEKMTFKAKPASKKVRVLPLKSLKSMVNS